MIHPFMTFQKTICLVVGVCSLLFAAASPSQAATKKTTPAPASGRQNIATLSKDPYVGAISIDVASGKVLFEDSADTRAYPASVLKLMDMLVILERIEHGQLSLTDQVPVSARAAKTGGSQVYLAEHESFTVEEMLYALMIKSANDVAVALAEKVAGSPEAFVALMNQRAKELGMKNTVFQSVHGLPPSAGQQPDVTTPRDLAILCRELLKHPSIIQYTSTRKRTFRPEGTKGAIVMENHDHLLGSVQGCDGLKTGYFLRAGYSIALTAQRNGQRVLTIVMGSTDRKKRDAKASELLNSAFVKLMQMQPPPPPQRPTPAPAAAPLPPGTVRPASGPQNAPRPAPATLPTLAPLRTNQPAPASPRR
jgi:D-alanyl-D-alanine carboxypeptidase (penicillin-binding protein 5/6)